VLLSTWCVLNELTNPGDLTQDIKFTLLLLQILVV
jgi:hypothetical protein